MKNKFTTSLYFTFLFILSSVSLQAQSVNQSLEVTWPFGTGTADQVATYTVGTQDYFNPDYFTVASNLKLLDKRTTYTIDYTRFQPIAQSNNPTDADVVTFGIRPKTGLQFKPTRVTFNCQRYGTDGGKIDVKWKTHDGTETVLQTGIVPARDNSGSGTSVDINLSSLSISPIDTEGKLLIYIYSLGNNKQVGLANIKVTGEVSGTLVNVTAYTLDTEVVPASAGSITRNPVGTSFDEGTSITLTANRNFGYNFSHWANASNEVVSTANPYTFTLNANTTLKAVFNAINTYELTLNAEGGAKTYMINASPAPTVVGGKNMYENGVNVTLTASNNDIFTFTNWENNETNAVRSVSMTENKNLTAVYSAKDYLAAWDFYLTGNGGRVADFASNSENEASTLVLRKADGTTSSWLDKSQVAAGGYEGAPAAVNWKPLVDNYYYQIAVNATEFTNLSVKSSMLFNYNAYSVQKVEYSLNGTDFTTLGQLEMTSAKVWYPTTFALPAAADHAPKVYIRWIPDYTSAVVGTASSNDGTAISGIYVFGNKEVPNDGIAPVLLSSIPANNGINASATGKIVLNFDEKVQIVTGTKATLDTKELTPIISGKTITFPYTGLEYNKEYTFTLPANTVSDLTGNTLTTPISIKFSTMSRPVVTKKVFDFVVGKDGDFKAALTAATAASSTGERFRIFFPDGEYDLGTLTGDNNQKTVISLPNVSYIGQSAEKVVLFNKPASEGIGVTATVNFTSSAKNLYMQDITLLNKMDYRTGTLLGRAVALQDQGNKNIYKNVNLLSNQDTYYSGDGRLYFEGGSIHGTVDFICGGGDVFFNEVLLYLEERAGNCITAPATSGDWGYVFSGCTIDGFPINNSGYRLGRPWQNAPKAVYLNTTMKVLPVSEGWGDPMNVVPAVFAEYKSVNANAALVDLSNRRTTYTKDATTVTLNPVLTEAQAANYTIENVLGGTDAWQPKLYTDQAAAPVITGENKTITWAGNNYVLCWAVFKDNVFVSFVTTNTYVIPEEVISGVYTVRAANEMGGLSGVSNSYEYGSTGVEDLYNNAAIVDQKYFTVDGKQIRRVRDFKGVVIVRSIFDDGSVKTEKIIRTSND
ncbi:MAG: pectin esterase [Bacteroidia bacterium]|nr:pectin esterase [Bacteroidia bacterium]